MISLEVKDLLLLSKKIIFLEGRYLKVPQQKSSYAKIVVEILKDVYSTSDLIFQGTTSRECLASKILPF